MALAPCLLIIAGETSGDIHGANLARALQEKNPGIRLVGTGGSRMRDAGVELIEDTTKYASVGIVEAFHQMHRYTKLYRILQSALRKYRPDACVLIDFPEFNLRFAARSVDHGVPVLYYISPQVWAWRQGRVKTIRRYVRKMLVVFPFEVDFYRKHGIDATFVGHPMVDHFEPQDRNGLRNEMNVGEAPLIGLLPGSRSKQFKGLFPRMKRVAELVRKEIPDVRFVLACAPNIDPEKAKAPGIHVVKGRTPEVLASSDLLVTASGTATVEAALHGTPMIVTYVTNPASALLLGPLIRVKDYAMVNILAGRRIMPEYYVFRAKPELMAREAISILKENRLPQMRKDLEEVQRILGGPGASERAAEEILKSI